MSAPSAFGLHTGDGGDDVVSEQHAPDSRYTRFLTAVVTEQVRAWLSDEPGRVLDIGRADPSRGCASVTETVAEAGHCVIRALAPDAGTEAAGGTYADGGRVLAVRGDVRSLDWFRPASVDAVVAEGAVLSSCLATEATVEQAARILRRRGRLLLGVHSLLYGLSRLAEQNRWPELADASSADVVLVPTEDGGFTRCFGPEELRQLVEDAGFEVEWVRPRTVLPPDVVRHALGTGTSMRELVERERVLVEQRQGEALGMYLTLSARRADGAG